MSVITVMNSIINFKEAYIVIAEYMKYYNNRHRHGSINIWPLHYSMKHL